MSIRLVLDNDEDVIEKWQGQSKLREDHVQKQGNMKRRLSTSHHHQVSKKTHSRPFTESLNHFIFHSHFSHVARGQVSRPGLKLLERESEIEMHLANVGSLKGKGTHTPCMGNVEGSLRTAL